MGRGLLHLLVVALSVVLSVSGHDDPSSLGRVDEDGPGRPAALGGPSSYHEVRSRSSLQKREEKISTLDKRQPPPAGAPPALGAGDPSDPYNWDDHRRSLTTRRYREPWMLYDQVIHDLWVCLRDEFHQVRHEVSPLLSTDEIPSNNC